MWWEPSKITRVDLPCGPSLGDRRLLAPPVQLDLSWTAEVPVRVAPPEFSESISWHVTAPPVFRWKATA